MFLRHLSHLHDGYTTPSVWGCCENQQKQKVRKCPGQRRGFLGGAGSKESTCQCKRGKRSGVDPWGGKIPWSSQPGQIYTLQCHYGWGRKWQFTPIVLPGKIPRTEEPGRLQSTEAQSDSTEQEPHAEQRRAQQSSPRSPTCVPSSCGEGREAGCCHVAWGSVFKKWPWWSAGTVLPLLLVPVKH